MQLTKKIQYSPFTLSYVKKEREREREREREEAREITSCFPKLGGGGENGKAEEEEECEREVGRREMEESINKAKLWRGGEGGFARDTLFAKGIKKGRRNFCRWKGGRV